LILVGLTYPRLLLRQISSSLGEGGWTAAALLAQGNGAKVTIATKLRHGDANTMMAEGGIQIADQPGKDSPYYHYLDTIGEDISQMFQSWSTPL